jgi:hypothetical protein
LDSAWKRFGKTWTNSIVSNLNIVYDHSDFISRIKLAKNYLQETSSLNALGMDTSYEEMSHEMMTNHWISSEMDSLTYS